MSIEEFIRRTKEFDINQTITEAVKRNEKAVTDMNMGEQLYDLGINSKGISLMSYAPYSRMTVRIKIKKRQPYNRVTLRDTGDFHKSFKVVYGIKDFDITATDWKTEKLKSKYRPSIFGLTEPNKDKLALIIKPYVVQQLKKAIT